MQSYDSAASCEISVAADLGIPYDSVRLGGGFATGCLVNWKCSEPVIPVDTTVNVDTSSVFWLDPDAVPFSEVQVNELKRRIVSESSYEWNFDGGNHFISFSSSRQSGQPCLIIHSNEKEFKDQYNGLYPWTDNWFADHVEVHDTPYGAVRLLSGAKAELFADIAQMLLEFNIVRHRFVAQELLGTRSGILKETHDHHYFMPTRSSVAVGCYTAAEGSVVPVFSRHGADIALFRVAAAGRNMVVVDDGERFLVPHGWGMTSSTPLTIQCDGRMLKINGVDIPLRMGVSLFAEVPSVEQRLFTSQEEFFAAIADHTRGAITDRLKQIVSYSRHGYVVHAPAVTSS
jgi:hypothetical protein